MTETPEKNDKRDDRFLDELLDSSLARYSQAEPRSGLEGRLLARLRSEPEPTGFAWRWMPLAAAAVLVAAAVLYFAGNRESRPAQIAGRPTPVVTPAVTPPQVAVKAPAPTASRPVVRHALTSLAPSEVAATRHQQFPSPAALSEQEQLLVRFVNQTPPQELKVLARQDRAEPIKELRVDALDIPPVVVGEADSQ